MILFPTLAPNEPHGNGHVMAESPAPALSDRDDDSDDDISAVFERDYAEQTFLKAAMDIDDGVHFSLAGTDPSVLQGCGAGAHAAAMCNPCPLVADCTDQRWLSSIHGLQGASEEHAGVGVTSRIQTVSRTYLSGTDEHCNNGNMRECW